jgi:site-specific DNA-methyltransferase (adenine-specific)
VIATIDWQHMHILKEQPPLRLRFIRFGIFDKPNSMPQLTGDRPAQGWEAIAMLHRTDAKLRWNGGGKRGVYRHNIDSSGIHPTAKPLSLYSELIQLFSDPNDVVFDPFAGSGASLRAAADLGRRAIGVELSPQYVEVAARRCQQLALFS